LQNPAPPDFFNAQRHAGAGGRVCSLAFSDDPIVEEPSGIDCGSVEILFSQEWSVVGKRFCDANGILTQRHFRCDRAMGTHRGRALALGSRAGVPTSSSDSHQDPSSGTIRKTPGGLDPWRSMSL